MNFGFSMLANFNFQANRLNFKGTIHASIPYIIIGTLNLFNAFLATLLPETAYEELPDTLEDGEHFGKNQKFWHLPRPKKDA